MDEIIEQYYNKYNFPGAEKLYQLLKTDKHSIKNKIFNYF